MTINIVSIVLSAIAFSLMCSAHIAFFVKIRNGFIKPNASSWTAWTIAVIVNVLSYNAMSKDIIVAAWTYAQFVMVVIVFLCAVCGRNFSQMTRLDWVFLVFSGVATYVLYVLHDARGANMVMVLSGAISFVPTILGLIKDPNNEKPLPWILLNTCYIFVAINIVIRWKGEWGNFAMPVMWFTGNCLCIWLSSNTRKRRIKTERK